MTSYRGCFPRPSVLPLGKGVKPLFQRFLYPYLTTSSQETKGLNCNELLQFHKNVIKHLPLGCVIDTFILVEVLQTFTHTP
jgi:hypothetical protein